MVICFVFTTEPLGRVKTKHHGVFLVRVYVTNIKVNMIFVFPCQFSFFSVYLVKCFFSFTHPLCYIYVWNVNQAMFY